MKKRKLVQIGLADRYLMFKNKDGTFSCASEDAVKIKVKKRDLFKGATVEDAFKAFVDAIASAK